MGIDFGLSLASAAQAVDVVGGITPLLAPNSSSVGTTVENQLVMNLPLAVSGGIRNSADFLKLTPGYQGCSFSARLNGGVGLDQEVQIDGATVSPVAFGAGIQGSQNTVPAFALQEFQVVSNNIEAQYGRTSTGVIKYEYKSGTNALHGSAFEYLRNQAVDARNFFAPTVAVDHQNEFGVEAGGPILIPHLYNGHNRTFFYMYYDGFRYSNSNPATTYSLLTPDMRQGNFSAAGLPLIYDPSTTLANGSGGFTRQAFPGNIIPQSEISPISSYFASLLPSPNRPGVSSNYIGPSTSTNNMDQGLMKIDQAIHNGRISASYNHTVEPTTGDGAFGPILSGTFGNNQGRRAIVNWDQTLSSNKLNHFGASFNRWSFFNHQGGQEDLSSGSDLNQKAGLGGILDQTGQSTINASGYYLGIGGEVNKIAHQNWRVSDDFTWIKGSHSYQFGAMQNRYYTTGLQQAGGFTPFGTFNFGPQETGLPGNLNTGFGAASFLLGDVDSATYGQQPSQAFLFRNWGLYAQDRWKIRHNLTLTYGLRWEYEPPITDRLDRLANFDPTVPNPGAGNLPGALVFAGNGSGRSGQAQFANAWHKGFGPRIGLAYSFNKDTVFRAAYGIMYDTNAGPAIFLNQQGYYTQATLSSLNAGVSPAFNWAIGFPSVPQGPFFVPTFANGGSTSWMQPNGARLPMVENWNVGIQRMLPLGILLDVSYVGTAAHHLLNGNLDYNQLNPQYLSLGQTLNAAIGSAAATAAGFTAPYAGFEGSVAQSLRPFPQYQAITTSSDPIGNNSYNALQARVQKKYSNGLSLLVSYTLSKDLTDADGEGGGAFLGSAQNYYNLRLEKAVAAADVPQAFVAAYTYDLPFGENKPLKTGNKILTSTSGRLGNFRNRHSAAWRAVRHQHRVESACDWSYSSRCCRLTTLATQRSVFVRSGDRPLFESCGFAAPAPFSFGNAPRLFSQIRAFGTREWDAALQKSIPIYERLRFSLKAEFFNLPNVVNWGAPIYRFNNPSFWADYQRGRREDRAVIRYPLLVVALTRSFIVLLGVAAVAAAQPEDHTVAAISKKFANWRSRNTAHPDDANIQTDLALNFFLLGQRDLFHAGIARALELDPGSAQAYYLAGRFALEAEQDPSEASRNFQKALDLTPASFKAHYFLGISLRQLVHFEAARDEFQKAAESSEYSWPFSALAEIELDLNNRRPPLRRRSRPLR